MLFHSDNLPYWILLGIGILLFLAVILSGLGDDDLDLDGDGDLDVEAGEGSWEFLGWLGIGQAPLILLLAIDLSLWGLLGWMLNVWLSSTLNRALGNLGGSLILLGSLISALIVGRWLAYPVGRALAAFGEDTSSDRLIGRVGKVTSGTIPSITQGKIGQVDVLDAARNLVTVSALLPEWAKVPAQRGDFVVLIERIPQGYLVIVENSLDQQAWLNHYSTRPSRPSA